MGTGSVGPKKGRVSLRSRKNKRIEVLQGEGCPEVPHHVALSLIAEIEEQHKAWCRATAELAKRLKEGEQVSLEDLAKELREGFSAGKDVVGTFGLWIAKVQGIP